MMSPTPITQVTQLELHTFIDLGPSLLLLLLRLIVIQQACSQILLCLLGWSFRLFFDCFRFFLLPFKFSLFLLPLTQCFFIGLLELLLLFPSDFLFLVLSHFSVTRNNVSVEKLWWLLKSEFFMLCLLNRSSSLLLVLLVEGGAQRKVSEVSASIDYVLRLMFRVFQASFSVDFIKFFRSEREQYIFWFKICMDDVAHSVQVIQSNQTLPSNLPCDGYRHSLVLKRLDHLKQVDSKYLEHHDEVLPIRPVMQERVEQLHTRTAIRTYRLVSLVVRSSVPLLLHPVGAHLIQDFHLVVGCLEVVLT